MKKIFGNTYCGFELTPTTLTYYANDFKIHFNKYSSKVNIDDGFTNSNYYILRKMHSITFSNYLNRYSKRKTIVGWYSNSDFSNSVDWGDFKLSYYDKGSLAIVSHPYFKIGLPIKRHNFVTFIYHFKSNQLVYFISMRNLINMINR